METNPEKLKDGIKKLKTPRLVAIVCLDEEGVFRLRYQFDAKGKIKEIIVKVPKKKPLVPSISDTYPVAELFEREIHDFFGVEFPGNTRLHDKLFLPEQYKGKPPLLKKGGKK